MLANIQNHYPAATILPKPVRRRQDRKYNSAIVNCEYNVAPFSGSERKKRRPVSNRNGCGLAYMIATSIIIRLGRDKITHGTPFADFLSSANLAKSVSEPKTKREVGAA